MRDKVKAFRDELELNGPDYIRANSVVEFLDRILSGPDLESRVSQLESQMAEIKKAHLDDGQLILNNGRYLMLKDNFESALYAAIRYHKQQASGGFNSCFVHGMEEILEASKRGERITIE